MKVSILLLIIFIYIYVFNLMSASSLINSHFIKNKDFHYWLDTGERLLVEPEGKDDDCQDPSHGLEGAAWVVKEWMCRHLCSGRRHQRARPWPPHLDLSRTRHTS